MPIGISFYTLQVVGYLLDVYKDNIKPEKHLGRFALFCAFFPQINAGPIERGSTLLPQLKKQHEFKYDQVASGMKLFAFGLFKKMVIADNLGLVVDRVFGSLPEYRGLSLVITILLYTWQIYMDFSGYTDMARGTAQMVGINLMENFNLPYSATSVRDFWRRWHISFSSWLRDYIYYPLGGNRKGIVRTILNTLIVFTISGLWHGAAWTFVAWGVLHGISISLERVINKIIRSRISVPKLIQVFYAYGMISMFWVFFRATSFQDALYILQNSFIGLKNFFIPSYLWATLDQLFIFDKVEMIITFGVLLIAVFMELIRAQTLFSVTLPKQPALIRLAFYAILIFLIIQFRNSDIKAFIYTKF